MGGRGKEGRQGGSLAGQTGQSLLSETKGGGEGSAVSSACVGLATV